MVAPQRPTVPAALGAAVATGLPTVLLLATETGRGLLASTSLPVLAVGLPFGFLLALLLLVRATTRVHGAAATLLAWLQLVLGAGFGVLAGQIAGWAWLALGTGASQGAPGLPAILLATVAVGAGLWTAHHALHAMTARSPSRGRAGTMLLLGLLAMPLLPWYLALDGQSSPLLLDAVAGGQTLAAPGLWIVAASLTLGIAATPLLPGRGRGPGWLNRALAATVGLGIAVGHGLYLAALPAIGDGVGATVLPAFNYVPLVVGLAGARLLLRSPGVPDGGFSFHSSS